MNNIRSILLMTFSMACFAVEDLFIKTLTTGLPVGMLTALLGLGGAVVFAVMALREGAPLLPRGAGTGVLYLRSATEGFSAAFIISALALVPLSTFSTVFQASPLAITLGAALFLRETVGWRRWVAIFVGFIGVLLIIRPGTDSYNPATLLVLAAVFTISLRDIISRRLSAAIPSSTVAFQGFACLMISGPILMALQGDAPKMVTPSEGGRMLLAIFFGSIGYYAIVLATRIGDASALAPFRYSRMIFALILGMLFLGERPDVMTYVGAVLIIGSGLFTYLRERQISRKLARSFADAPAE